ncbi:MAG: hypothetical protein ACE5EK_00785 [Nitrospinales bacterium]
MSKHNPPGNTENRTTRLSGKNFSAQPGQRIRAPMSKQGTPLLRKFFAQRGNLAIHLISLGVGRRD